MAEETKVTMEECNGIHLYTDGSGKKYPSVTTVLDVVAYAKPIVQWANNLGFQRKKYDDELKRTADQGTYVHSMLQCIVDPSRGEMPVVLDPIMDYHVRKRVKGFRYMLEQNEGQWKNIFTEKPMISHKYEMGGTMDWFAEWRGKTTLFDFKTATGVRTKHLLQLGGYYLLCQENNLPFEQAGIILVKEDRTIMNIFEMGIIERCAEIFLNVKQYYYDHFFLEDAIRSKADIIDATTL
jgi:hypothetical protein